MPELAEVDYYRRQWDPGRGGMTIAVLTHPAARIYRDIPAPAVEHGLVGRTLRSSHAHGKRMLFGFSGGAWLGLHLGMTGKLFVAAKAHEPGKADHLVIRQKDRSLVFHDPRMFGKLTLDLTGDDETPPDWWTALPPQPLDRGFSKRFVADFAKRFPKTPVKTLLLDQRGFPGIGNWMADEVCWQMRLDPATPVGTLDGAQVAELWKSVRHVSRGAMRTVAVDWSDPPRGWLFKHRWKDGGTCPRSDCRAELRRNDLRGRTTCWCPQCQG